MINLLEITNSYFDKNINQKNIFKIEQLHLNITVIFFL